MKAFHAEEQAAHDPQSFMVLGRIRSAEEQPERAVRLCAGARAAGLDVVRPAEIGLAEIAAVHTPEYLDFLQTIHAHWREMPGASDEVLPNLHLDRTLGGYPSGPVGRAAYHMADGACPIGPDTWSAAKWSAACAIAAARTVLEGARSAYALSRPPGHHAYADLAGGFCFLNNSAIAAEMLRRAHERVAILDVDVHHGNGTQGIFYERPDVLTVSLHADPDTYYPYLCGHAHERGAGAGVGYNLNIPLPRTTGDADYMPALDRAIGRIRQFAPGALVVALGLDAHVGDPLKGMQLSTGAFTRIGAAIGAMDLPTVLVQEGGYLNDALADNLTAALTGFMGAHG